MLGFFFFCETVINKLRRKGLGFFKFNTLHSTDLPRVFLCQLLRGQALELLVPLATKYNLSRPEKKTRLRRKQQGARLQSLQCKLVCLLLRPSWMVQSFYIHGWDHWGVHASSLHNAASHQNAPSPSGCLRRDDDPELFRNPRR